MKQRVLAVVLCSLLLLSSSLVAVTVLAEDWPMFRHDPQHTGFSSSQAPHMTNVLWNMTLPTTVFSSPSFWKGRLYIGGYDGNLYCIDADPSEGTKEGIEDPEGAPYDLIWTYHANGSIVSSPAIYDNKVYFGGLDGTVYCILASRGTQVWNYSTDAYVSASPLVIDEKVYVGSEDGTMYCLNAQTGEHIWEHQTSAPVQSSPALSNGKIYVGSDDNSLYCLYASNGTLFWQKTTGGMITSSPTVVEGKVYVGSDDRYVYCYWASNGTQKWRYETGGKIKSSPAVMNGNVFVGSNDRRLYCLNMSNGSLVWSYETGNAVSSSPLAADGKVYVGSTDEYLYCVYASNGSLIWRNHTNGAVYSSPSLLDMKLYCASYNGNLMCIRNHNAPNIPESPHGVISGIVNTTYRFISKTIDAENDPIYYQFNWGDGKLSNWIGPFQNSETVNLTHEWTREGDYNISIRAMDSYGYESTWSIGHQIHIMILTMTGIRGGLGVHAYVNNVGGRKLWDLKWNITIIGGRVHNPANGFYDGTIEQMDAGETEAIYSGPFFEVGKIKITLYIQDKDYENIYVKTVNAFAFGYLLFIVPW